MKQEKLIPPGSHWSGIIKAGGTLKIVDLEGGQGVDFLCYNADNTKERYHACPALSQRQKLCSTPP